MPGPSGCCRSENGRCRSRGACPRNAAPVARFRTRPLLDSVHSSQIAIPTIIPEGSKIIARCSGWSASSRSRMIPHSTRGAALSGEAMQLGITLDCLPHKAERLREACCRRHGRRVASQVEVVGGEVDRWAVGRTYGFRGLQCRLDNPGEPKWHFGLEVKYVFEGAVEAVGPEMRTIERVY